MAKVSFPHMGNLHVPLQVLFQRLGIEVVIPPVCSSKTLYLGSHHSPEWVCVPYKLVLGNFLQAIEQGADALVMLGGPNNCRFGYYTVLQRQVLEELGCPVEVLAPQISSRTINGVTDMLRRLSDYQASPWECLQAVLLALAVLRAMDELERKVQGIRPREVVPGEADAVLDGAIGALSQVKGLGDLRAVKREYLALLEQVPLEPGRNPIRICLVGEIYVVHEPFINMNLEKELGKRGVEVRRSEQVSQWLVLSPALLMEALGIGHEARIAKAARPYLEHLHGETVGQTVMAFRDSFDGVIQLTPFTCTPEIVNLNVMTRLRKDYDIPFLSIVIDEQSSALGQMTRLEAFVDLLARRRQARARIR